MTGGIRNVVMLTVMVGRQDFSRDLEACWLHVADNALYIGVSVSKETLCCLKSSFSGAVCRAFLYQQTVAVKMLAHHRSIVP